MISFKWGDDASDLLQDDKELWASFLMSDEEFTRTLGNAIGFHSMPEGLVRYAINLRKKGLDLKDAEADLRKYLAGPK